LQPWHKYHGQNVLAPREPATALVTVYFTSGSVIAMDINTIALSEGWK
jgi:hypothetical protein